MENSRSQDLGWRGRELILRTRAWPDGTVPLSAPRQVQAKPLTRVWTPRGAANQSAFESLPTLGVDSSGRCNTSPRKEKWMRRKKRKERAPRGYTAALKVEMWDRWGRGESLKAIGRVFSKEGGSVYGQLAPYGGIRPRPRCRSPLALSLAEREEISRGVAAGRSIRSIAQLLGRAVSTVSREIRRNGGRSAYRATEAEQRAWSRSRRPRRCRLSCRPKLQQLVEDRLRSDWTPEQIAGWLKRTYPGDESFRVTRKVTRCPDTSVSASRQSAAEPSPRAASLLPVGVAEDSVATDSASDDVLASRPACPPLPPDSGSNLRCGGPRGSGSMAHDSACGRSVAATAHRQGLGRPPPARPTSTPEASGSAFAGGCRRSATAASKPTPLSPSRGRSSSMTLPVPSDPTPQRTPPPCSFASSSSVPSVLLASTSPSQ